MLLYTLEVHAEYATLHLRDLPRRTDVAVARAICHRLPESVRMLRVNFHAIVGLDATVKQDIEALVRDWRRERLGLVAVTAAPPDDAPAVRERLSAPPLSVAPVEASLMATFL